MTIQEMKLRKQELGYTNEMVAKMAGIPLGTVIKVFSGATRYPRRRTIEALEKVLSKERNADTEMTAIPGDYRKRTTPPTVIREAAAPYGTEASTLSLYTVDDYRSLPDDKRYELIDGALFVMEAPSVNHQLLLVELVAQFRECQKRHKSSCTVICAPCNVQLDCDEYTVLQPDLFVVCDREKLHRHVCYGAPDLTLEIMSVSSRSHDSVRKLAKYKKAGVKEYWLVDPENRTVIVYEFSGEGRFHVYSFSDRIPVGIFDNTCEIDLSEIEKVLLDE